MIPGTRIKPSLTTRCSLVFPKSLSNILRSSRSGLTHPIRYKITSRRTAVDTRSTYFHRRARAQIPGLRMYEKGSSSNQGTYSEWGSQTLQTPAPHGAPEGSNFEGGPRGSTVSRASEQKICRCGRGYCKVLTSKKDHSRGRRFYCCPQSSGVDNHGCGMFEWVVEDGGPSTDTVVHTDGAASTITPPGEMICNSSVYARGYLDGIIKGSEQQINVLKDVVAALKKLDVNRK